MDTGHKLIAPPPTSPRAKNHPSPKARCWTQRRGRSRQQRKPRSPSALPLPGRLASHGQLHIGDGAELALGARAVPSCPPSTDDVLEAHGCVALLLVEKPLQLRQQWAARDGLAGPLHLGENTRRKGWRCRADYDVFAKAMGEKPLEVHEETQTPECNIRNAYAQPQCCNTTTSPTPKTNAHIKFHAMRSAPTPTTHAKWRRASGWNQGRRGGL